MPEREETNLLHPHRNVGQPSRIPPTCASAPAHSGPIWPLADCAEISRLREWEEPSLAARYAGWRVSRRLQAGMLMPARSLLTSGSSA